MATHSPSLTPLCTGGPALSPIVAGAWRLGDWGWDAAQRLRWIEQCIDLGVTSFDHADIYGGYTVEALFGEALQRAPGLRDRLQLVSKCGIRLVSPQRPSHGVKCYDTSRAHIVASVEASLSALRTDRLELLLIHRPDPLMNADEVAEAFSALRQAGKVLHFGVSNFTPSQFELLDAAVPLSTNQVELHPLHLAPLHDGTLDQAQRLKRRPMIWSPLAGGRLFTATDERTRRVQQVLAELAQRHHCSVATIALAWLLRHPSRPLPVIGSRRVESLSDALAAQAVRLSAEDWTAVWQASQGQEVP